MINYFDEPTPLTISMWDLTWLTYSHPGGDYEDLDRRVAEAAELGYNCLRIDTFPHLYLKGEYTFAYNNELKFFKRYGDVRMPGGYTVDVRQKVIELADSCRRHGVKLGLDAWVWGFGPVDTWSREGVVPRDIPVGEEETYCRNLNQVWVDALPAMRDDGVLERALYVSPMNEVPLAFAKRFKVMTDEVHQVNSDPITKTDWSLPNDPLIKNFTTWIGEGVKEEIKADGIPLCYSTAWADNFVARIPEFYDLIDVHFMPDMRQRPEDTEALEKAGEGASGFSQFHKLEKYDLALYSAAWNRAWRHNFDRMYELCHTVASGCFRHNKFPSGKELPVIMTETFGPCNFPDHPDVDWTGYKQHNEDAARIFSQYPFAGLSLSNMAEPIFSLWDDKLFHQRSNEYIQRNVADLYRV